MFKRLVIILFLFFSVCNKVLAETPDFSKMLLLQCTINFKTVFSTPLSGIIGAKEDTVVNTFYVDYKNKNIYSQRTLKPVTEIFQMDNIWIKFKYVYNEENGWLAIQEYVINRQTGVVDVTYKATPQKGQSGYWLGYSYEGYGTGLAQPITQNKKF